MNDSARLLNLETSSVTLNVEVGPTKTWPPTESLNGRIIFSRPPKKWPDFLHHDYRYSDPQISLCVLSGRVVADLMNAGLADGEFTPVDIENSPISYFAIHPRSNIWVREMDISAKRGYSEPVFASYPDYGDYIGHSFVLGRTTDKYNPPKQGFILCIPEILNLAIARKWTGVMFRGFSDGGYIYESTHTGKVRRNTAPRVPMIERYYAPENVIAADLVRARELAAELQTSPDTPEWTRRSFEIVRKALAEAPHTLGYPDPKPAKPRAIKPGAPLLSPKAIKALKLDGEGELMGEVELGRPLFGSDTLSVIVSDAISDDDAPEISFTKSEMKRRAKAALEKLETCLPALDAALDAQASASETSPANFRSTLHDPGVFLCTADMAKGDRWAFTVEDDIVQYNFEFDGDKLIETWAAD